MLVISNELETKISDTLASHDMSLYYIDQEQIGNNIHLVIFIQNNEKDKPITLDDCVTVTREISGYIDDYIDDAYILEVSSPGTNRTLFTDVHLKDAQGENVELRLKSKVEGIEGKKYIGLLNDFDDEKIVVSDIEVPRSKIKKIMYVGESND